MNRERNYRAFHARMERSHYKMNFPDPSNYPHGGVDEMMYDSVVQGVSFDEEPQPQTTNILVFRERESKKPPQDIYRPKIATAGAD